MDGYDQWKLSTPPSYEAKEKSYIFEIGGEIEVPAYSEEGAYIILMDNLSDFIKEGISQRTIEII